MKKIFLINYFRILKPFLNWVIYGFSSIIPKNKCILIFIGWHKTKNNEVFSDNSKYLFLYTSNNKEKYGIKKVIWITPDKNLMHKIREKGYLSFTLNSFWGIFYSLIAKYTISDTYLLNENWRLSGNSKIVNLWHGIPLKKIGFQNKDYPLKSTILSRILLPGHFTNIHKLLITSRNQFEIFKQAFNCSNKKIIINEYPRSIAIKTPEDELYDGYDIDVDTDLLKILKNKEYDKKIMYAPTFRRGKESLNINKIIDFDELSIWLKEKKYFLAISLHIKDREQISKNKYDNIYFIDQKDNYPLYKYIDLLICDYSSVSMDFLLINKPSIYYIYDINEYRNNTGLNIDPEKDMLGEKIYDFKELIPKIEEVFKEDKWINERKILLNKYHPHKDENFLKNILEKIIYTK